MTINRTKTSIAIDGLDRQQLVPQHLDLPALQRQHHDPRSSETVHMQAHCRNQAGRSPVFPTGRDGTLSTT
jgi:hypothetical protein